MSKVEHILRREDGSEIKIVAQDAFGAGLHRSVDVYALARESSEHPWRLLSKDPAPNWREMSREDYIREGRSEMFRLVGHGEIFRAVQELNEISKQCVTNDMTDYEAPQSPARQRMGRGG